MLPFSPGVIVLLGNPTGSSTAFFQRVFGLPPRFFNLVFWRLVLATPRPFSRVPTSDLYFSPRFATFLQSGPPFLSLYSPGSWNSSALTL